MIWRITGNGLKKDPSHWHRSPQSEAPVFTNICAKTSLLLSSSLGHRICNYLLPILTNIAFCDCGNSVTKESLEGLFASDNSHLYLSLGLCLSFRSDYKGYTENLTYWASSKLILEISSLMPLYMASNLRLKQALQRTTRLEMIFKVCWWMWWLEYKESGWSLFILIGKVSLRMVTSSSNAALLVDGLSQRITQSCKESTTKE